MSLRRAVIARSCHCEQQGDEAVERLLQGFALRNDGITRNDNTPSDEKRQRLAFQAPQTAITPGIKIIAQMILSRFDLTQPIWPNK